MLLAMPALAEADVDTFVPGGIATTESRSMSGPATQTSVAPLFIYKIRYCNTPYIPVAASPAGYVVGNCLQNVHLYPQATSTVGTETFYGGWVYGNYSGCGWVAGIQVATGTDASALCPAGSIGYNLNEFASYTNADAKYAPGNDCNKDPVSGNCTDGSTTSTSKTCTVWGNYRPWASGQGVTDAIYNTAMPTGTLAAGSTVKWRYVARYPTSGNISYAMIKLAGSYGITAGYGNWGFINVSCLSSLPYKTAV